MRCASLSICIVRIAAYIVALMWPLTAGADNAALVDLTEVIPDAVLDLRYATKDNFTNEVVYPKATCKLRRSVAVRLARAAKQLRAQNRRLLIWDCYRPASIQEKFWKLRDVVDGEIR